MNQLYLERKDKSIKESIMALRILICVTEWIGM